MSKRTDPLEVRFWDKVDRTDLSGCWLWTAAKLTNGYGQLTVNGRRVRAHRLAYEMYVGEIPEGDHIDHLCNNRACVRPSHLEAVSQAENNRRVSERGRHASARRTHCPHGHEYTPENTYVWKPGSPRRCRRCIADRVKRRAAA